ncbi:MAG: monoacylglycerol lipase [Polyangiales bacterium]
MQPSRDSITSQGRVSLISNLPFAYEEGSIDKRAEGSPTIAYQLALPAEPKASVLVVHGYGEHGGRYRKVVEQWARESIASAVLDLRGHGWSAGARGYCNKFSEYHEDVTDVIGVLRERLPSVPLFAFGHSFGALVVSSYALAHPQAFKGLAITSPYFGLALAVPSYKKKIGELASRVWPHLSIPTGLSGNDLTHDETLARLYDNDPLVSKGATARWYTESLTAQREILARAPELKLPVLCVQAGADRVASPAASRAVFERLGATDKHFDERTGLYHEVLNEPKVGLEIAEQIGKWILARV